MIKNLIPGLPELGKIKAGRKGKEVKSFAGKTFRLPEKLDHFIITTTERNENGDYIEDAILMDKLKKSDTAVLNKDGNLVGIPINLLYNDIQLNFPNRYACYASNMCICSGNGKAAKTRDGRFIDCPCERLDPNFQGKDKCKANGKLYAIIEGTESVGACHVLRTTSINSVKSILGGLAFIQAASSGLLAFMPLTLMLSPKAVITPSGAATTVYISSIIYRGSITKLRKQALGMAKEKVQYLIEMDRVEDNARQLMEAAVETDEEAAEVQAEFYPDAVDVKQEKEKPKPKKEPKSPVKKKTKIDPDFLPEEPAPEPPAIDPEDPPDIEKPAEEKKPAASGPIIQDQKRKIVALKKQNKITSMSVWSKLLEPWDVKSANFLTEKQANEFIEVLKTNPTS